MTSSSFNKKSFLLYAFVIGVFLALTVFVMTPTRTSAYFCGKSCFGDGDCSAYPGAFCANRQCKCGETDPGICGNGRRCPDRGAIYADQGCPAGYVGQHIDYSDCRGAGTRPPYGGGILSYCKLCILASTPTPIPPTPTPPSTPPCTSPNTCAFTGATCTLATGSARDADGSPVTVNIYEGAAIVKTGTANPNFNIALPFVTPVGPLKITHALSAVAVDYPKGGAVGPGVAIFTDQTAVCLPPVPAVVLTATSPIPYLGTAVISWNAPTASSCTASGGSAGWAGARAKSGSFQTTALTGTTVFSMYCTNDGGNGPTSNATVTVNPPLAPTITSIKQPDYCTTALLSATVAWSAQTNSDFQVQAARDSAFNFLTYDSKNPLVQTERSWWERLLRWFGFGDEAQAAVSGSQTIPTVKLAYNQKYYVRVRVRDNPAGPWSPWSPNVIALPGTLTWFSTPTVAYPVIKLSVTPAKPIAKQPATFSDDTQYKGDAIIKRTWDFGDGTLVTEPPPPISGNTKEHTYASEAAVTAKLTVQTAAMPAGVSCSSAPLPLNIGKAIPNFKEVRP